MKTICTLALALGTMAVSISAEAGDIRTEVGASAGGTGWRGDAIGYTSLKLGYRFIDVIGLYGQGQLGYGVVDERMLTCLSLGAQAWARLGITRPYARLSFVHQHEESLSVVAGDVGSAIFGIGEGIRHRAGGELGLGLDIPFAERDSWEFYAAADAWAKWFPDDLGPAIYAGGGASLGVNYAL